MKTLAELKRDAKSGKISGELIYRFGDKIPERLQGLRKIVDANTVCIKFQNADGKLSELRIEAASLIEYTDETLTVFAAGERQPNEAELAFMKKWEAIADTDEHRSKAYSDAMCDGSTTYYERKRFFIDGGYGYLLGYDRIQGKKYNFSTGLISDNAIRGDIQLQYKIFKNS